jgi:hypothetical protein
MAVSSALALTLTYTQYTLKRRNLLQQLLLVYRSVDSVSRWKSC